MHYYSFHIGDYSSHTRHLSLIEDLAYRRLLDYYYLHEAPIDPTIVARHIGMRDHEIEVSTILKEFFTEIDSGYIHNRADREIAGYRKQSEGGKKGAKNRWEKEKDSLPIATPMGTLSPTHSHPIETPIATINHKPLTSNQDNSVTNVTGETPKLSPDEIIFGYGVPMLTNAGTAEKQARSFLGGLRKQHGDQAVVDALRDCIRAKPLQPLEWLSAALPPKKRKEENFSDMNYGQSGSL